MTVLLVTAGGRCLALATAEVQVVLDRPAIEMLPGSGTDALAGMIAHAGAPVPVVDLARLEGRPALSMARPVVVLRAGAHPIGCLVEAVGAFTDHPPSDAEPLHAAALWQRLVRDAPAPFAPARLAAPLASHPSTPPVHDVLNVRVGRRDAFLPMAQLEQLLDPEQAVILPRPVLRAPAPPLTPFVLLHEQQAITLFDLGCSPGPRFPLILARLGTHRFGFAVEAVLGIGPACGALLDLLPLAGTLPPSSLPPPPKPERHDLVGFLAVVLGGRPCLLPLGDVRRVLAGEERTSLPGLRHGAMRAVSGQILPGIDARALLGVPAAAPVAHDIVLHAAGTPDFFLLVEQVAGLVHVAPAALHWLPEGAAGPISAVVQHAGQRHWVLHPPALFEALTSAVAA